MRQEWFQARPENTPGPESDRNHLFSWQTNGFVVSLFRNPEGYFAYRRMFRSGHNEAVLKNSSLRHSALPKTRDNRRFCEIIGDFERFSCTKFFTHLAVFSHFCETNWIRRDIEAVITRRSWKPFDSNVTRVRIPFPPPKIDNFRQRVVDFYLLPIHYSLFTKNKSRFLESNK